MQIFLKNVVLGILCSSFVLFLGSTVLLGQTQEKDGIATLTVGLSSGRASRTQQVDFEITLRNVSSREFYVCGEISLQDASAFCNYTLQVRRKGNEVFQEPLIKSAADALGARWRGISLAEFKDRANAFLLRPGHSLGIQTQARWAGFIAESPGIYEVRVVYVNRNQSPNNLGISFLQETIISNVVEIEVLP